MIRLRKGTVGLRFTIMYAALFLLSGVGLLALTFLLSGGSRTTVAGPGQSPPVTGDASGAQRRIEDLQSQLDQVEVERSRQLLVGSLLALIVMVVVSLLLGRALAGRVLRPLRVITAATRRISADNLDQRLAVTGPADEVKNLADTIDGLLERLEGSFRAQRRFVANASHELRTPLATMRAQLDVAVAKPQPAAQTVALADRLRTQLDRVDHLLDGFLVLARAQHGALADLTPVELGGMILQAVDAKTAAAAARRLDVTLDLPAQIWTGGSPALLARMVENVIDNAVVHNEPGGWIRIGVTPDDSARGDSTRGHAEIQLVVQTGGQQLDQEAVDRLARPFERLGAERTGSSGLGLSIVAAIAAAHGGRLELLARPEGGLRVTIALPALQRPVQA